MPSRVVEWPGDDSWPSAGKLRGAGASNVGWGMMSTKQFVESRRERWTELDALVKRGAAHGLNRLSGDELFRLGRLYRAATSDLAIAQRDFPADRTTLYLNALLARAHPLVYQQQSVDMGRVGWFLRYGFPEAYRTALPYIAVAFGIFALSALVSALLVFYQPSNADTLLPMTAQELRSVMQHHHLWVQSATSNHSVAANFIMLNNIQVAFFAFAGGLLAGAGTVLVLVQNGILFGSVMAMAAQFGLGEQLWAFIVPHGVIELSVIFMAAGAGLMVGDAMLRPGLLTRREALMRGANVAIRLVLGAVPLLVVAGTIEGFLSPSNAPDGLKLAVGLVTGTLLYSYVLLSRPREQRHLTDAATADWPAPESLDFDQSPARALISR